MRPTTQTSAFSLVEVMCAVVILSIGLVGLTQGLTTALSSSKECELQTTAAMLAAGQIETVRAEGFITDGDTEGDGDEGLSLYHWKQSITSTSIDGLHEVKVAVEHSQTGKAIYELRTLLFDPPITPLSNDSPDKSKTGKADKKDRGRR